VDDGDIAYTIVTAAATSSDGNYSGLNPANVSATNLDDDPLVVTSLIPTSTGFIVNFSQAFDAALLNTSDANNALGAVDVTLVGATVGNVRGTIVVDPGQRRLRFIKSGGLLAADSYTVTLRSSSSGFATPGGALLDGNADGTTGDDFVGTFTQSSLNASTVIVSVGDFIRGYGQTVNLPATATSGIPISLSTGQGIGSANITLRYNPALLTISGGTSPISGATANIDTSTPGIVTISVTKASEFSSSTGSIVLANLTASVPDNAAYTTKEILDLTVNSLKDTSGGDLPTADDDGLHISAYRGDLNGDRTIGTGDVTLALRLQSGVLNTTGFTAFQLADSYLVSDMNDDGTATTGDVTGLLRFQSGAAGGFPRIPAPPTGLGTPPVGGPDPQIFIPTAGLSGGAGQVITVPVKLNVTEAAGIDFAGVRVDVAYDAGRFAISNVRLGSALSGQGFLSSFNIGTAGSATLISAVDLGPHFVHGFVGDLFLFDLTVKAGAAAGSSAINLLSSTGATDNDTLDLTISPTISNGADVSDGQITVIAPGITVTSVLGLTTTEAGGAASFTVVLDTPPTANVTIGLSSSNTAEGTVSPASLTFTAANWNTAQTVTLTGVDDFVDDGDIAYTILTAAATSADGNYDGLNPTDLSVTNTDNDTAGITVSRTSGLSTTEAGGTDSFTVVLGSQPTASVTVGLSSSNAAEGAVSPTSLTFTAANWNTAQTVTLTGVDDFVDDGDIGYTIVTAAATSSDGNYSGINPADVSVTNNDNDTAGITVSPTSGLTTTEAGGTASFTVVLTSQPTASVTIGLSSSNTAEGTVSPASLTFTAANWNTTQTVTVTGVDDFVDDGDIAYSIVTAAATSADGNYSGLNPANVSVTNNDDDTAGIRVSPTSGLSTTEAGGTATFTIVLTSQPTANVTIGLSSSNTDEGTVSPASLTFTAGNWNTAQTVTVTGVDDFVDDGDIAYTIVTAAATSADGNYNNLNPADVTATNNETNRTPTDILLSNSAVQENITGKSIGNLTAVDADTADTHTFFVTDTRFVISGSLLSLAPGVSLDRAIASSIPLDVTTRDSGSPYREFTKTFDITVLANPFPWQNKPNELDTRNDGNVIPLDALAVINELNGRTISDIVGRLPKTRPADSTLPYFDVNGDGFVTPIDALRIVNALNHLGEAEGEAEESKLADIPLSLVLQTTESVGTHPSAELSPVAAISFAPATSTSPAVHKEPTNEKCGQLQNKGLAAVFGWPAARPDNEDSSQRARKEIKSDLDSILDEIAIDVFAAKRLSMGMSGE
jgi:hypothetical protein